MKLNNLVFALFLFLSVKGFGQIPMVCYTGCVDSTQAVASGWFDKHLAGANLSADDNRTTVWNNFSLTMTGLSGLTLTGNGTSDFSFSAGDAFTLSAGTQINFDAPSLFLTQGLAEDDALTRLVAYNQSTGKLFFIERDSIAGSGGGGGSTEVADGVTILGDGSGGDPFRADTTLLVTTTALLDTLQAFRDTLTTGAADGNGIYSGSGTVPSSTVATLTDNINFTGGNFGIGVTPSQLFDVNGIARFRNAIYDGANSAGTSDYVLTTNGSNSTTWKDVNTIVNPVGLNYWTLSGGNVYRSSGNVYVNSTTGAATFFVKGGAVIGNSYAAVSPSSNGMVIQGAVAIGTTAPSAMLDINGVVSNMSLKISSWYGASGNNKKAFSSGDQISLTTTGSYKWRNSGDTDDVLTVAATTSRVGIKTTSPSQPLHVNGNARITGAIYDSNNDPGTSGQILSSTVTGTDWIAAPTTPTTLYSGNGTLASDRTVTLDGNRLQFIDIGGELIFVDPALDSIVVQAVSGNDESDLTILPTSAELNVTDGTDIKKAAVTDSYIWLEWHDGTRIRQQIQFDTANDDVTTLTNDGSSTSYHSVFPGGVWSNASDGTTTNTLKVMPEFTEIQRQIRKTTAITPTPAANQDDWNPTGLASCSVIRANPSVAINITGITAQSAGTEITIFNISANDITLKHEDASSSAANRFALPNGADLIINDGGGVVIWYDSSSAKWRAIAN